MHVGWSAEYGEPLNCRTPATFAARCDVVDGTLLVAETGRGKESQSSCTVENGDSITCDWMGDRCTTLRESSEKVCERARYLAYVAPDWWPENLPTPGVPPPDATPGS